MEWGQSFSYDGFGNLLNQTVTKGAASSLAVNVDGNMNRIITDGYAYDANGNLTAMPLLTLSYDVENRLAETTHSSMGTDRYVCDASNLRVWKRQEGSEAYTPATTIAATAGGTKIILNAAFYQQSAAGQAITLLHELLHLTYGGESDADVAARFGIPYVVPPGVDKQTAAGCAVSDWLRSDCGRLQ